MSLWGSYRKGGQIENWQVGHKPPTAVFASVKASFDSE